MFIMVLFIINKIVKQSKYPSIGYCSIVINTYNEILLGNEVTDC